MLSNKHQPHVLTNATGQLVGGSFQIFRQASMPWNVLWSGGRLFQVDSESRFRLAQFLPCFRYAPIPIVLNDVSADTVTLGLVVVAEAQISLHEKVEP